MSESTPYLLDRWAAARERRNGPGGFGETGTKLLRTAARELRSLEERLSHYEISPREREDEAERDRRDFDTDNEDGEDERRDPQPRLVE